MLPKVANHLLHHTARAISVAQNQTGHTIRNVLQLQSSSTPSTASGNFGGWNGTSSSHSNWNGRGAGSGGAKSHPGGRSYAGYTGAGRAVTQAESMSVNDLDQTLGDDSDDVPPALRRGALALKSHGAALPSRARLSARDVPARSQSTVSTLQTVSDYLDVESPPASSPTRQPLDALYSRPHSPDTSLPTPPTEAAEESLDNEVADHNDFSFAAGRKDRGTVEELVAKLRSRSAPPSVRLYNSALLALHTVRVPNGSLGPLLELYNDMLARSVAPNFRTYVILIQAFTDRDRDVHEMLRRLERPIRWQTTLGVTPDVGEHTHTSGLRAENNFRSAMMLFQTVCADHRTKLPLRVYHNLLQSCANHANTEAAVHVFAHFERRKDVLPSPRTFELLMSVYNAAGDWEGVKDVFEEFRKACKSGMIFAFVEGEADASANRVMRSYHIDVWNSMIEAYVRSGQHTAALGLLEQMLDTKAGDAFNVSDVPPPSIDTFSRLITSFCQSGEVSTALAWFNRLLLQVVGPRKPLDASTSPGRPDNTIWTTIIEALCLNGRVDDLLTVMTSFERLADQDGLLLPNDEAQLVLQTLFRHLTLHPDLEEAKVASITDTVLALVARTGPHLLSHPVYGEGHRELGMELPHLLLSKGKAKEACRLVRYYVVRETRVRNGLSAQELPAGFVSKARVLHEFLQGFAQRYIEEADGKLSLPETLDLGCLFLRSHANVPVDVLACCQMHYAAVRSSPSGLPTLSSQEWAVLVLSAFTVDGVATIEDVLADMARADVKLSNLSMHLRVQLYSRLRAQRNSSYALELMRRYDPAFTPTLDLPPQDDVNKQDGDVALQGRDVPSHIMVDQAHSAFVSEFWPMSAARIPATEAYKRFEAGRARNKYPRLDVMARLIIALGRQREFEKVRNLYDSAQLVLQTMEGEKERQSYAWFLVEDGMILALAHGGEANAAHVHRLRIIDHGGAPSADAYGALIHAVKDTTDDASNAIALFREARQLNVVPNTFMYNTTISKLARARKADDALALFKEMKTMNGMGPSSVTYGAVIAACCRVGDVASAENLFAEMASCSSFKPRVPPYNTMMQVYTTIRPDRARALHYFDALTAARIQPTAHTYKLLLDAYGTIEPVDAAAMGRIFDKITTGRKPIVQGTHWASLIHSVGYVQGDVDGALALFDTIASHPSTRMSGAQLPDAVVFESLIAVLATHRRVDLIPIYVSKMKDLGIHMTAYIANFLIKAYASAGDIERSREIFEGLADPPEGVAAPHNHAPHDAQASESAQVPVDALVYREPSTWEAMVRAELAHRHRERAVALLDRAQARKFPPAVWNRINGILLDDSVSPWAGSE
ncbi:hypothetical protein EVJ58_g9514 [Rhodofomes roseus]|uniref:PROP1-like PPR domain-containing protein n=1 Tax=Rhodofomes roseus TaxID=34475 RepID=A0A4Y9XU73_9APHY|nr:hypothetical protein EVJ58_g9514 [Rhodofomes roseus]